MSFEGQKEGFASIRIKPAIGRSGVIPMYMFPKEEVGNPAILCKLEIVTPTKETSTMISIYETSVA